MKEEKFFSLEKYTYKYEYIYVRVCTKYGNIIYGHILLLTVF